MVKALSVAKRLEKAVSDYLLWMISADYASGSIMRHERLLNHFQNFITYTLLQMSCEALAGIFLSKN